MQKRTIANIVLGCLAIPGITVAILIMILLMQIFLPLMFTLNFYQRYFYILIIVSPLLPPLCLSIGLIPYDYFMMKVNDNVKGFRELQNHCYSCGADIKESRTAKTCPQCNSNLDFNAMIL